jgi:PAS domain S-box-containing protein
VNFEGAPRPPASSRATKIRPTWRRIIVYSALAPLILIAIALWLGGEYDRAGQSRVDVRQSYELRRDIERLFSLMQDAETGHRGYLISGDPGFLDPYRQAQANLAPQLARVEAGFDGRERREDLELLERLVGAKFAEMQLTLELRDSAGTDVAFGRVKRGDGKRLMDQIRGAVGRMTAAESALLEAKMRDDEARTDQTWQAIWIVIGLAGLFSVALGVVIGLGRRDAHRQSLGRDAASARQRAIFDYAIDGIVLINPSGSIETINPAAERMFGYAAADLLRRDISTLVDIAPGEGPFLDRLGLRDGRLERAALIDVAGRTRDGSPIHVDMALGAMPLADGMHIVASMRDIADRKEIERLKDDFIATVSHELRTPLTSVMGSLGLLRSGAAGALPEQAQRLADIAENNCQRLIRLINDILDMDQLRTGRMAFGFTLIDLREVARRARDAMQGLADRKSIAIELDVGDLPAPVCADIDRLVQVTSNLLSNAIQYSPTGSSVTLRQHPSNANHVLEVVDQGPGISEEFGKRIFGRFTQGDRPDDKIVTGSGLGLAISREIVRSHGGEIWFENVAGQGSRFAFAIPEWLEGGDIDPDVPRRLLVCEDDADVGATIRSVLSAHGYEADIVASARAAIPAVRTGRYGAVLLDLTLDDADGADVLRAIRASDGFRELPVIVVSGSAPPADDGHRMEVAAWVRKPFDPQRLIDVIEQAMRRAQRVRSVILHVDDDADTLELFATALGARGRVIGVRSLAAAREFLAGARPDAIVLDLGLSDGHGAELLAELRRGIARDVPVIVYSAQTIEHEVQQLADAVLVKSRNALPRLVETVTRTLDRAHHQEDMTV